MKVLVLGKATAAAEAGEFATPDAVTVVMVARLGRPNVLVETEALATVPAP